MAVDLSLRMLLGALLVGCYVEILLQGILFAQINYYFHWYRDDRQLMKLAVAGLAVLTALKTCQAFAMLWIEFIDAFADPDVAFNNFINNWTLQGNPLMVAVSGLYVRIYFCYRLWVISKAWWTVALVATTDLLALSFIGVATRLLPDTSVHDENLLFFTLHFSFVFIGDLLLTLLTAFFLFRTKKGVLPRAHGFINALIWLTFQTAAPGAICSLISLVISQLDVNGYQLLSAFNEILPKLYAVSMMWTLNARHELRNLSWGSSTISRITTTPRFASKPRNGTMATAELSVPRDDSDVELRPFPDGVKLQNDMLTHVDFHDPFGTPKMTKIINNDVNEGPTSGSSVS